MYVCKHIWVYEYMSTYAWVFVCSLAGKVGQTYRQKAFQYFIDA